MNAKTLKALNKSIKHWRENAVAECPEDVMIGPRDCPLCGLFRRLDSVTYKHKCDGCPVFEHTGFVNCVNTPYTDASMALVSWAGGGSEEEFVEAALEEVEFLKSLRK